MTFLRAFRVKAWVIHNLLPIIGDIKDCRKGSMQSDVQLANILEHLHADESDVTALVRPCHVNKFVPQVAELVLGLRQSLLNIEFASRS